MDVPSRRHSRLKRTTRIPIPHGRKHNRPITRILDIHAAKTKRNRRQKPRRPGTRQVRACYKSSHPLKNPCRSRRSHLRTPHNNQIQHRTRPLRKQNNSQRTTRNMEPKLQRIPRPQNKQRLRRRHARHTLGQRLLRLLPKLRTRQHLQRPTPHHNGKDPARLAKTTLQRQLPSHQTMANQKRPQPRKPPRPSRPNQNYNRNNNRRKTILELPEQKMHRTLRLLNRLSGRYTSSTSRTLTQTRIQPQHHKRKYPTNKQVNTSPTDKIIPIICPIKKQENT